MNETMNEIVQTLSPKEVIAYYNQQFVVPLLRHHGFEFKEKVLEYHRRTKDFKQVIWHRCDRYNETGIYIGFEMGYSILCPNFKTWYKKEYGKEPIGGDSIIGYKRLPFQDKWNDKYNKYIGVFGYDLVGKDISDQFAVIMENLQNVILPHLNYFKDFEAVIDNPSLTIVSGEFDLAAHLRQIEHCLFLGDGQKARKLAASLAKDTTMPASYYGHRDAELIRIFKSQ